MSLTPKDTMEEPQVTQSRKTQDSINWDRIYAQEEGEKLVINIVQDIVKKVMNFLGNFVYNSKAGEVVYEHYIQRRVVPFAVLQAQQAILSLTEVSNHSRQIL